MLVIFIFVGSPSIEMVIDSGLSVVLVTEYAMPVLTNVATPPPNSPVERSCRTQEYPGISRLMDGLSHVSWMQMTAGGVRIPEMRCLSSPTRALRLHAFH